VFGLGFFSLGACLLGVVTHVGQVFEFFFIKELLWFEFFIFILI
jgi:hypothetical protein